MGAGGESTKNMKRVSICPIPTTTNSVSSKSNKLKSLAKLKHKNSSKTLRDCDCDDDDVEKQQQAGSRRARGGEGKGKGKTVLFWVVGVLGALMLLELMVAIAVLLGPMVGMMTEVKETLQIVTDYKAVIEAGSEILAPTESEEEANTTTSSSVFLQWCESSPCMAGKTDLCSNVDTGLASARKDGLPVLPFPQPFCDAVEVLSTNQCLCDADLGNPSIAGDAAQIVQFSGVIEHMCSTTLVTPDQGACQ